MAQFQKGNKIGNRFTHDRQPEGAGRKPKLFTTLRKRYGINLPAVGSFTRGQITDLLQSLLCVDMRQAAAVNLLMSRDIERMAEQVGSGEEPEGLPQSEEVVAQVFTALAQAINYEARHGKSETLRWIIEYLFGKAVQPVEGDIKATIAQAEALTTEEIEKEIKRIERIRHDK